MEYQHAQVYYAQNTTHTTLLAVSKDPIDDYEDDDEEASSHHKNGVAASVFSYVCTCVGVGVLSLPNALRYCGWFGLIMMFVIVLVCNHTGKYLCACMFAIPGRKLHTYEEIGEAALGPRGKLMVGIFQTITLFGVCIIFLILIGKNMETLVPQLTYHDWALIFGVLMIPVAWLKTMKEVSVLAIIGVLASLFVAVVVVVKGFMRAADSSVSIQYHFIAPSGISNSINIIAFAFGGHSVLPNIVSEMRAPRTTYRTMVSTAYLIIGGVYMMTAAAGYAGYGADVQENILSNIDPDSPLVKTALAFITFHIACAFPIPLNPVSKEVERWLGIDQYEGNKELTMRIIFRTALVVLAIFISAVVPYFLDILSLVSALSIVIVVFVFPPWFYYLLYRPTVYFTLPHQILMVTIVVMGLAASGIGVYYATNDLISDIQNGGNPFSHYFKN